MKAVYRNRYAGPEILEVQDLPKPAPRMGEVLIRVHAATVSRTDCGGLWGRPYIYRFFVGWPSPRHTATGCDFAGVVEGVGEGVTEFRPGDRVWGFDDNGPGTHAQLITYPVKKAIAPIPAGLDFAQAAACAEGAHYALNFLRKVKVGPETHALVYGATGAIGSAAVQFLKAEGAKVTAVCAGPQVQLVRSLGADRVLDYLREDFTREDVGYDFVFDAVGKSAFGLCRPVLKPGGAYLSSELGPRAENLYLPLLTSLFGDKRVLFPFPSDIRGSLNRIGKLVEEGKFRPLIDKVYAPGQIQEAFAYVASGRKIGNVILNLE